MVTLNYLQLQSLLGALNELQDIQMPFKLSMLIARNISALQKEKDFFIEQEQQFMMKYLEVDEETHQFKEMEPNVFAIKKGLEEECVKAREEMNAFTVDVELRKIPLSSLEGIGMITPKQLVGLELILEEEE